MSLPVRSTNGGGLALSGPLQTPGLRVVEGGAAATSGVATLTASTVTVNTTAVTANSRIQLTAQSNTVTGALRVSARTPGTSFAITSSVAAESGPVAWMLVEPGTAGL